MGVFRTTGFSHAMQWGRSCLHSYRSMMFINWLRPTLPGFLALAVGILPYASANEIEPDKKPTSEATDRKTKKKSKKTPTEAKKQAITPAYYGRWERLLGHVV